MFLLLSNLICLKFLRCITKKKNQNFVWKIISSSNKKILITNCFKKLQYIRYFNTFIIFANESWHSANFIKNLILNKLKSLGLIINLDKIVITHLIKQRRTFLGFEFFIYKICKKQIRFFRTIKCKNTVIKMYSFYFKLNACVKNIFLKLVKLEFAKKNTIRNIFYFNQNQKNFFFFQFTHFQILQIYNNKVKGLINYFSILHNKMSFKSIMCFIKFSCALVLTKKFKLTSMSKIFKKLGFSFK